MIIIIEHNIEWRDSFKEVIGVHLPLKGVDVRDIDAGAHYELTVPNGERESGASLVPCVRKILLLYDLIAHNRFVGIRDIAILHHDGGLQYPGCPQIGYERSNQIMPELSSHMAPDWHQILFLR